MVSCNQIINVINITEKQLSSTIHSQVLLDFVQVSCHGRDWTIHPSVCSCRDLLEVMRVSSIDNFLFSVEPLCKHWMFD